MRKNIRKKHSAYDTAVRLLARREHTKWELAQKLAVRGFEKSEIESAIDKLIEMHYQSDERFVKFYIESSKSRGYGPYYIRSELKERNVGNELIDKYLNPADLEWIDIARAVVKKKYGAKRTVSKREQLKQMHFLYTRGFTMDQIKAIFKNLPMDLEELHED